MNGNRLSLYLKQMQQAAANARRLVVGINKDIFLADKRTHQAVLTSAVTVGQAATNVLDEFAAFAEQNPEVPWRSLGEICSGITSEDLETSLEVVWDTVEQVLPELLRQLPTVLYEAGDARDDVNTRS